MFVALCMASYEFEQYLNFFSLRATSYLCLEICSYAKAPPATIEMDFYKGKKKLNYDDMMTSE